MIYPKTKVVQADVIGADGAVCIGCEVKDGKIFPSLSVTERAENGFSSVSAAGYSSEAGIYAVCSAGNVYRSNNGLNFSPLASLEALSPFLFEERANGRQNLYIAGDGSCVYLNKDGSGKSAMNAAVRSGVMRCGRLFAVDKTDGYKLTWSEGGNALGFDESAGAGWAYPCADAGEILNLVNFGDRLVAVCRHGLAVISAFGTPENFKVEKTIAPLPGIIADTAAAVRGKLYFFTESGLYAFDGSKVAKVKHSLENDFSLVCGAASHGNLYLAAGYSAALKGRAALALNAETGGAYLIDFPAEKFACGKKIYGYAQGTAAEFAAGDFTFISGDIGFLNGEKKHLNRIEADCEKAVDIEIFDGRFTHSFKGVKHAFSADICGVNFKITVKSDAKINALRAYAEVFSGV